MPPSLLDRNTSMFHLNVSFQKKDISTMPFWCYQYDAIKSLNKTFLLLMIIWEMQFIPGKPTCTGHAPICILQQQKQKITPQIGVYIGRAQTDFIQVLLYNILTKFSISDSMVDQYICPEDTYKATSKFSWNVFIALNCSLITANSIGFLVLFPFFFVINI